MPALYFKPGSVQFHLIDIIPENIRVNLYAVNNGLKQAYLLNASNSLNHNWEVFERNIGTIMVLNKYTQFDHSLTKQLTTLRIDRDFDFSSYKFEYYTFIQVCNNHLLEYNDCSLTLPYAVVRNNLPNIERGMELSFFYSISEQPGIQYFVI